MQADKKSGPPTRPTTFQECHTATMNSISELEKSPNLTADDKSSLANLKEVATLAIAIMQDFKGKGNFRFMVAQGLNIKRISNCLEKFDEKTWAPKVNSSAQAQVANIYSEFIRDVRDIIRTDAKKPEKERQFNPDKMDYLKKNNVEGVLMSMAETASENRSQYRDANKPQAGSQPK